MDRHIACLQIPAFGIVLACAADSALRNRPVAVAPMHTPRALVREISTEAFHEGLQPGMPVDLARLICPGLRMIPPDPSLTQTAHRELQHRISSFAPAWESIRPGSLFLDLTGTTRLFGTPIDTVTRISLTLSRWSHHLHGRRSGAHGLGQALAARPLCRIDTRAGYAWRHSLQLSHRPPVRRHQPRVLHHGRLADYREVG